MEDNMDTGDDNETITVQFKNDCGDLTGDPTFLPRECTVKQLESICNQLLQKEEEVPFLFFIDDKPVKESLDKSLGKKLSSVEKVTEIIYVEQAAFHVRPVTRCSSSIPGHGEAVLSVAFSPDGCHLASGSGDTTVRLWDVGTETPHHTCKGHKHWVLCIAWSPDGKKLASGCKNSQIFIWDPENGKQMAKLSGHKQWINYLCWEPLHRNPECRKLASASKDGTVRIWDVVMQQTVYTISAHTQSVTCVKWGGTGLLYTSSQDKSVKVWRAENGTLCRTLVGHGHWVNTLALNVDYVLRTGAFDLCKPRQNVTKNVQELAAAALRRYTSVKGNHPERLVSGSDDFTLMLWNPESDKKPITRMTGHQQTVNDVKFSPDMRLIASASFDKSIKLWNGQTGKFLLNMRGHVQAVYQIAWSADSRLLVSGSADSTLKVWDYQEKKLMLDLPGHADEVYAVDWSPDGERVVSGGKDKVLKM